MGNLKEIRTRIASVTSTQKITSAMKMVSAAKLRKAQDAVLQMRPYAEKLHEILTSLSSNISADDNNPYITERALNKALIVVITSNGSLCGAFNANIVKKVKSMLAEDFANIAVDFAIIGKKGGEGLRIYKNNFIADNSLLFDELTYENSKGVSSELMNLYASKQYDKVVLVYNKFKNAATQIITTEQFLPIELKAEEINVSTDYIYEPNKQEIVTNIIPMSLQIQFYQALTNSFAAEHGARMTAMHKATDNAADLIQNLKLEYNKARQASITNQILEIVGGAEALKG